MVIGMVFIELKKVLKAVEEYKKLNESEKEEFRNILGLEENV